jgi:beta-galactosidase
MPDLTDVTGGRLVHGGEYHPEQWSEEVWDADVELMREAGITLVSVGVSWGRLEPSPGARNFGRLDRVFDVLHDGGIKVALVTPTASPPPWLSHRHPETTVVDFAGARLSHGSRNHFCPSSPIYRRYARDLLSDLAERYAGHPALALWHLDNESREVCYCDVSAEHFRSWLRTRYDDDLDGVNRAWSTTYGEWAEIRLYLLNPGQRLDFTRFSSDALIECLREERDIVRLVTPDIPVSTNVMGVSAPLDHWHVVAEGDVVSHDWFPDLGDPTAHVLTAMSFDIMRGLAGGRPWFLRERPAGGPGRTAGRPAGHLKTQAMQAVARGSDSVCLQWRASRSRIFTEVVELGADLAKLDAVVGQGVPADVAIVLDWDNWWAVDVEHHPSDDFDLHQRVRDFYEPLWQLGVMADFVPPTADLSGYRVVLVPNLYLATEAGTANIASYVEGGGTLVLGFFSGVVDEHDHVRLGGYPAPFQDVLGLRVEEFRPQRHGVALPCASALLGDFTADFWAEDLVPTTAEVVATITGGDLAGMPAVLRNAHGRGTAWYVATRPAPGAMRELLEVITDEAGVESVLPVHLPEGVEAVRRGELLFLVNHRPTPTKVPVGGAHTDLLTGERTAAIVELGRYDVRVLTAVE